MNRPKIAAKRGFSLLELSIAMTMMAVLSMSSMVLLRTSQSAWSRHRDDHQRRHAAAAVLRHITRQVRQAVSITAISDVTDSSGSLSLVAGDGKTLVWEHNAANQTVLFGQTTATDLLAEHIDSVTFAAYSAVGSASTTDPDLIHSIYCTLTYTLNRPEGPATERLSTLAWIRSW